MRRATVWRWYLGVGLAATVAFLLLPSGSHAQVFVHLALHVLLLAALVVGVRIHRPSRPAPWYVLTGGVALYLAANAVWFPAQVGIGGPLLFPSFTDVLYLGGYAAIAVAMAMLAAAQARGKGAGALLDALMIAAAAGVFSWMFLAEPLADTSVALLGKVVTLGYPVIDLLILVAAAWLVFVSRRMTPALGLVGLFVFAQLGADVAYGLGLANGSFVFGTPLVGWWTLSFAFLGAAALHPSMRELGEPSEAVTDARDRVLPRVVVAIALGPAILVVESLLGRPPHAGFVGLAVLLLLPLAALRVRGLTVAAEEHRRILEELRRSEERYRLLVEELPAFAYVDALDPGSSWGTRTVYASPQIEQFLGVTAHALVDDPGLWDQLVHPDDREREHVRYAHLLATGEPYASELRLVRPDGRIVWIRHQAVPLSGGLDADASVQGVIYDITADREAHQALLDSEARFRALMEEAPDAVLVVDAQGAISMANRRAEHIFGFEPHELVGRQVEDLVPEHLRGAHVEHRARYGADPSIRYEGLEVLGLRKDGSMVPLEITLGFVPGEDGATNVLAFVRDVTTRERAEAALVEAEARYRTLVERIPAIVYVAEFGEPAPWLFVSPQAGPILGYEPEEWIADEALWMRLIHPEDLERVLQAERASRASGERFECEYRMFARDGREVWIRDEAEVVLEDAGASALLRGIMYDVTERRLAEDALRRHDRILEAVSLAGEALLTGRWEERIDDVAAALGEAADVSRVFVLTTHSAADGEPLLSYRHEWCAPGVESQIGNPDLYDIPVRRPPYSRWADILAAGGIVHGLAHEFPPQERAILDKQGVRALVAVPLLVGGELWGELGFAECVRERVWDHQEVEALRAAAGVLSAAVARQRSEDAVRASEERFRLLSEAAVEGVIVDVDGRIVEANHAFSQMFGLDPGEVVGSSPQDAVAPESLPLVFAHLTSGSEAPTDLDIVRRKDGVRLVVEATLRHIEHGGRPARLLTLHDITARKQAEAALAGLNDVLDQRVRERTQDLEAANVELTTAKEVAEEANRAKSEFLSRASHELRTPLNAILGFGQLLQMASLPEEDEESVEQILTAGGRLLKVVDRVLGIARVDAGAASVSLGLVALDAVIEGALSIVQAAAEAGGVLIRPELRSPVPTVIADRERLAQVFAHLLSNAVKHSREGDVVTVWCERPEGSVRVHITDRGPGIPGERLERLFALFGTLEGQTGAQGAGVGLPLAKAWVEAMGGTLGVHSEVGVGTTFTVELAAAEEPVR